MEGINQFLHAMPEVAQDEFVKRGVNSVSIGDGVSRMSIAGHNQGVAYYFKTEQIYNPSKSAEAGYEVYDPMDICFSIHDRKNISTMPVQMAPRELLSFNRLGECIGGKYRDSYLRWKEGKEQPGLALRKWDVIPDSMVASLEAEGIYTVEQFAAYPRERFSSRFPQEFIDAHARACQWVAGKEMRENAAEQSAKYRELEKQNKDLMERLAKLEALSAGQAKEEKEEKRERVVRNKLLED
jgi:hypothetical protein